MPSKLTRAEARFLNLAEMCSADDVGYLPESKWMRTIGERLRLKGFVVWRGRDRSLFLITDAGLKAYRDAVRENVV